MCTVPVLVFSMNSSSSLSGGMRVLAVVTLVAAFNVPAVISLPHRHRAVRP